MKKHLVTDGCGRGSLSSGSMDPGRLFLNLNNHEFALRVSIPLPVPYRYEEYRMRWHAGYQSEEDWPLLPSGKLRTSSENGGRDARTNWELNRHYQFALLAKDYYASDGREWFLQELTTLFDDWNERNPFLWGIAWTSTLEIAVRLFNWCLTLGFLAASKGDTVDLKRRLENGILRMAEYLYRRSFRCFPGEESFVEASALLHAGILAGEQRWTKRAIAVLGRDLRRWDSGDGVSRGGSLRYQALRMEACALDLRLLRKNSMTGEQTEQWIPILTNMAHFLADSVGVYGERIEYGDSDDGKLFNLVGGDKFRDYYGYVMELMSLLLSECYVSAPSEADDGWAENVCWLFSAEEREAALKKKMYSSGGSVDRAAGGRAILRSADREVLIGINHAAPGYYPGSAHGHVDSLSFQAYVGGEPLFCDPGTYLFSVNESLRRAYRGTRWHNTICIGGRDQSGMPGIFRWQKRASCRLIRAELGETEDVIEAEHDGYRPVTHRRKFHFDRVNKILTIEDHVSDPKDATLCLLLSEDVIPRERENSKGMGWRLEDVFYGRLLASVEFLKGFSGKPQCVAREISKRYGYRTQAAALSVRLSAETAVTVIRFGESGGT